MELVDFTESSRFLVRLGGGGPVGGVVVCARRSSWGEGVRPLATLRGVVGRVRGAVWRIVMLSGKVDDALDELGLFDWVEGSRGGSRLVIGLGG